MSEQCRHRKFMSDKYDIEYIIKHGLPIPADANICEYFCVRERGHSTVSPFDAHTDGKDAWWPDAPTTIARFEL